ncbi:MAG: YabP/YqfC family sporulation protein [Clostridium sp.]|jgi:sporulation protein YqfC|nr:YabP/YqfC family sporulation protein [Clostridium sp.]
MKKVKKEPFFSLAKKTSAVSRKESLLESLQLPKDVCLGALRVTMTGNTEAWIENYKGILEYTGQNILLQAKTCQVCFEGSRLAIDYYTNEDMKISGCITSVRYL